MIFSIFLGVLILYCYLCLCFRIVGYAEVRPMNVKAPLQQKCQTAPGRGNTSRRFFC